MSSSRFTLISHGPTQAQHRASFPLDEPILENEIGKITDLNWKTPAETQVWSAPGQRMQQTSPALGLAFTLGDGLRDYDYGRWRGRKMDEVQIQDQEGILKRLSDPSPAPDGGRPLESVISRVGKWMEEQRAVKHTSA
jgi:broad specificity phosphatase PhoE